MCAKLLQLCPTLCNPMHRSLPGSPVHGYFPGKNTGMGCYFLLQGIFPTQGLNPPSEYSLEGLMLNTLTTWCEELTHWKRSWCWERLKAGGEGDNRRWDGWMTSLTGWTWIWISSGSQWRTGKPGVLQSMGSQRVDTTEWLNWNHNGKECVCVCVCVYNWVTLLYRVN